MHGQQNIKILTQVCGPAINYRYRFSVW